MVDVETKSDAAAPALRRFAPNAAKAGAPDGARGKQQPSYVFLRVKRKRHEDPVETLLVQSEPELKRQQREGSSSTRDDSGATTTQPEPDAKSQQRDLLAAFTKLTTKEDRGFVFTRIDTLESHQVADASDSKWAERLKKKAKQQRVSAKKAAADKATQSLTTNRVQQQQARGKERRQSEVLRSRGLSQAQAPTLQQPTPPVLEMKEQKTLEMSGLRMVDLTTVPLASSSSSSSLSDSATLPSGLTVNGVAVGVKRVLNPYERELDESVWKAFQQNDFSDFFRIFHSHRPELRVDPAAFQRPADGGTVLMAAALHGRVDVIEAVLRSSATKVLQEDWNGATASAFARQSGHKNVEAALLACEEAEREKEYVYDVYCIDVTASEQRNNASGPLASEEGGGLLSAPVVSVSSAVQRWLSQEAGQSVADAEDDVDEFMLESDNENDVDSDGESIDSNHENYAYNDYPDEESSGSEYDSEDSEANHRRRAAGTLPSQRNGADEQVCADEVDDY